jgi:outer membrane lipoprotein-sorting protein
MSPANYGPATVRRGLKYLSVVAALTAALGAGEDRTASPPSADTPAKSAKTTSADQKTPAEKGPSAKDSKPTGAGPTETPDRLAVAEKGTNSRSAMKPESTPNPEAPIQRALRIVAECQERYQSVSDYTCTFFKRERISGRLIPAHIMDMKVRTKPQSIYLRFQQPAKGREAIYIAGRHGGKVLAHDVGLNKVLAGTLALEPTSSRAMDSCRHPITEAGIGPLLETISKRWAIELNPNETVVKFADMLVGEQRCVMIETSHPQKRADFLFYRVRLYIDKELGLPIRFEAYDWPKRKGDEPQLAEEYNYSDMKLNVGLSDLDFDVANGRYSFGRF